MFNFIKQKLKTVFSLVSTQLSRFWNKKEIDEQTLKELELILLQADTDVQTTQQIMQTLKEKSTTGNLADGAALRTTLEHELNTILGTVSSAPESSIYLLVGINGSGKTTTASKLAYAAQARGQKPLLVAADTFRAAATEQLAIWAEKASCDIVAGTQNQDPASVVFTGAQKFAQGSYDLLIIDTAGRLQTKSNLMAELAKIKRMIERHAPDQTICTLLTVDSMLGQNSFEQAKLFHEATQLDGIVLTKMDSTAKGGIIFSIATTFGIPVVYISYGEQMDQLKSFDAKQYVQELLG